MQRSERASTMVLEMAPPGVMKVTAPGGNGVVEDGSPKVALVAPDLRCKSCGYGVAAGALPGACPTCGTVAWETAPWRPFSRDTGHPFFLR